MIRITDRPKRIHSITELLFVFVFLNRPGPSAPLPWVRDCVLQLAPNTQWRQKILLGLNLYGLDFASQGTEPILGGR